MVESSIVPAPPFDKWGAHWMTEASAMWSHLKSLYFDNGPVLLFGKGPSFNTDFNWVKASGISKMPPVAVNEACIWINENVFPEVLTITCDESIFKKIPDKYIRSSIAGVRGTGWPLCQGSGNYALGILGALGVKEIITIGIDNYYTPDNKPYGHDYGPYLEQSEVQIAMSRDALQKNMDEIIFLYKLNVKRYEEL